MDRRVVSAAENVCEMGQEGLPVRWKDAVEQSPLAVA